MNWFSDPARRKAILGAILLLLAVNSLVRHDPVLLTIGVAAVGAWALAEAYRLNRNRR